MSRRRFYISHIPYNILYGHRYLLIWFQLVRNNVSFLFKMPGDDAVLLFILFIHNGLCHVEKEY